MERLRTKLATALSVSAVAVLSVTAALAQPVVTFPPNAPATTYAPGGFPPSGSSSVMPPASTMPPALGVPTFDPYSAGGSAASLPPSLSAPPSPYGAPMAPGFGGQPSTMAPYGAPMAPGVGAPTSTIPPYPGATGNVLGTSPTMAPYGQPYGTYPPGATPGTVPPSLYPNGTNMAAWGIPATKFLTPRIRYSWVGGGEAYDDLAINDFDFSVVAAFPNFLFSTQPLYVAPSFSLHLWSGPRAPNGDLPANAYSAFLDFGWSTDPTRPFGGEIGFRPGVFTDFNTVTTNSWRFMGQGLFRVQTTPTTTLRGGVIYIDRNDLKLLPAFGVLWTPNPQTRFDIFFPSPRLAQHLTTAGNMDLWWYVGGEYGGGAWTVERQPDPANGQPTSYSDRIDINDIRVTLGLEWGQAPELRQGRRSGFVEVGWVTDREVVYVVTPSQPSMNDSFMLRAGWNY